MASCTIVDEVVIEHTEGPSDLHIALTDTSPDYNPSYARSELDNHHVSVSIRPSKEFAVWSVKEIYEGIETSTEESFCSYCQTGTTCHLIECVSIPGVNISQKDLLESDPQYKTEKTTTYLCTKCCEELRKELERLVEKNTANITSSKL